MGEQARPKILWEYGVPDTTSGLPSECPVNHIASFLEKCDMIKINNVNEEAIQLRLFPFSLRDRAKEWLRDEGVGAFDTWDKLVKAFLVKYLGQEKSVKLQHEIATFHQPDDESLYEAWRRFLRLQRQCPHHGIPDWMLIQNFYNGITGDFRIYIDAASGGSLMSKSPAEAKELIERMAANDNYHPSSRHSANKGGKYDVVALTLLTNTVQSLSHKFDHFQVGPSMVVTCQMCGVQRHAANECQFNNDGMSIEQANALYNSNQRQPFDPYSNTYNEGWKHNPAFSYKNTQAQLNPPPPPRNNFNSPPGFQARAPFNQGVNQQPSHQKTNMELMMENLIQEMKAKINRCNNSKLN
ncbi:uncharacterized protein LOC104901511 [Beta vulgaris subsp. vulgaris]|uniref:uncharacterized protein LOC104901511 n=1 Tax=Beta vulgaris subsp. vulgaris TaxID=3555 RepID=UPI00053FFECE|nr:uncharacterized protein LOC104901511 [Beta vulgaris subsp. vulgaris]